MFEKWTETARRTIFFGRYEASQFGSREIAEEHLLLGILREDKALANRLLPAGWNAEKIRAKIPRNPGAEKVATSVDLSVSHGLKRALTLADEESRRYKHSYLGPEHLLLGLVRNSASLAARILQEAGITEEKIRLEVERAGTAAAEAPVFRDLSQAAEKGELAPLVGRETEVQRVLQILLRRTRNNAALVGEPGVGKRAIVRGLAAQAPGHLFEFRLMAADAVSVFPPRPDSKAEEAFSRALNRLASQGHVVICIEGLFDLAVMRTEWSVIEAMHLLEAHLSKQTIQFIGTGTNEGLRRTLNKVPMLGRNFEAVTVPEPAPDEAIRILQGVRNDYEKFHGVVFADDAITTAVHASARFLPHRSLPDRALDLLDDAGALVRLRDAGETTVTAADIEQAISSRTGMTLDAVRAILQDTRPPGISRALGELTKSLPVDGNPWLPLLAEYIARTPKEQVGKFTDAIQRAAGIH